MTMLILALSTVLISSAAPELQPPPDALDQAIRSAQDRSNQIDQTLQDYASVRNFMSWAQLFMNIIRQDPWVTPRVLEDKLRRLNIDIYLVARPAVTTPNFCARLPFDPPGGCREFSLWIGTEGREHAEKQMKEWGATTAENLERLTRTGFLTRKSTSETPL